MAGDVKLTAYDIQVLIGTSISGCSMSPDRVFDIEASWAKLYKSGLIDRTDGIACPTTEGGQAIASILAGTAGVQCAWQDVIAERRRQVEKGWTPEHDDAHDRGELARAAAYYAVSDVHGFQDDGWGNGVHKRLKPWDITPKADRRKNLVIGAAMMIAEIERLDRAALRSQP